MIYPTFSIFDSTSREFAPPYALLNVALAKRSFAMAAAQPGTPINSFPTDFILYEVGTFDNETGEMNSIIPPINHGSAIQQRVPFAQATSEENNG